MTFKPMLAQTCEVDKLTYPLIAQPKYDGIRCVVIPGLGPVTRTLKPIPNNYIRQMLAPFDWHDGEILTYTNERLDELNTVQSKVMRADGQPDFAFYVFDHIQHARDSYTLRFTRIEHGIRVINTTIASVVELVQYEEEMVAHGWEGVILRKPSASYKFGRSTVKEGTLLKMKRFHDSEAIVTGFVEKMTNTNEKTRDALGHAKRSSHKAGLVPAGTLGALEMRWKDGTEFEIGTGFDTAQRDHIWRNRDKLLSDVVTFKYQRVGPNGAPLLPVFRCFRKD